MIPSGEESFLKQNDDEIVSRMNALVKSSGEITVWQKGQSKFHAKLEDFNQKKSSVKLIIDLEGKTPPVPGDYLMHFVLRNVAYFVKGKILIDTSIHFEIEEMFKHEKRGSERLLTYPHHKAFILIPIKVKQDEKDENILYISKNQGIRNQAYVQYSEFHASKENLLIDNKSYRQLRLLDLSKKGASFFANSNERTFLDGLKNLSDVLIEFNDERYLINSVKILYGVDYIDPRATHVPMYKIGVSFEVENESLGKVIRRYLGDIEKSDDLAQAFEDKIK